MATSEMSKSSRGMCAAPATYICPKLSGTIAAGVVLLGVLVLMLFLRTDYSKPVANEASLPAEPVNTTPVHPALAASIPVPSIPTPSIPAPSTDETGSEMARIDKGSPSEPDEEPAIEPAAIDVSDASDGKDGEIKSPGSHPNVLRVVEGNCFRSKGGDMFRFRDADGKEYIVHLAGVFAPKTGSGLFSAGSKLRGKVNRKQVRVEFVSELDEKTVVGWVSVDGESVNEFMITEGLAWYDPRVVTSAKLEQLQEKARAAHRGIWKGGDVEPPFRTVVQQPPEEENGADSTSTAVETSPANTPETPQAGEGKTASPAPSEPPKENTTAKNEPPKAVVDQSTPEKVVTAFLEALKQNDLDNARSLISSHPIGFARSFREGTLRDSAVAKLRETFDGASIRGTQNLPKNAIAVLMETTSGGKAHFSTYQRDGKWAIVAWNLPR